MLRNAEKFYVSDHLPEELNEKRHRINQIVAENKAKQASIASKMTISKGKLFVNGEEYNKPIKPLTVEDFNKLSGADMLRINKIPITQSLKITDKGSEFQTYSVDVTSLQEV